MIIPLVTAAFSTIGLQTATVTYMLPTLLSDQLRLDLSMSSGRAETGRERQATVAKPGDTSDSELGNATPSTAAGFDRLLTAREVGERLGLSTATVLDWFEAGRLPGFRLGGRVGGPVRFHEPDFLHLLESWRVGPRPAVRPSA